MVYNSTESKIIDYERVRCREWYSHMLKRLEKRDMQGRVAVDVGAGHGYITSYLKAIGIKAFALDINISSLKEDTVKGFFILGDASQMPFRRESLNIILAFEIVEHLKCPLLAMREFQRCLKNNGYLLMTTPTPKSPTADNPGHVSIRSRNVWIKLLNSIGFEVTIVTYQYPVHIPYFPIPRHVSLLLGRALGLWKRYVDVSSTKLVAIKKMRKISKTKVHLLSNL